MDDEVNLPDVPLAGGLGFESKDDLDLLLTIRNMIRDRVGAMGLHCTGSGLGCGGADVSFRLGDRNLSITLSLSNR